MNPREYWYRQLPHPLRVHFFFEHMEEKYGLFSPDEIRRMMMESALMREDCETADLYMRDAIADAKHPQVRVEKFSPGEHYYAFRQKFDSFEEARRYAEERGYRVLSEVKVTSMDEVLLEAWKARREKAEGK